jgi:hypothetical protein
LEDEWANAVYRPVPIDRAQPRDLDRDIGKCC